MRGVFGEVAGRAFGPLALHGSQSLAVEGQDGVAVGQQAEDAPGHHRAGTVQGDAIEHPASFAQAFEQAGLAQDLEMARDARLALAEDAHKVADRQVTARAQGEESQPGILAGGTQAGQNLVEGGWSEG